MDIDLKNSREYALWILLLQTRSVMYRAREIELAQYGVTPEQFGALFMIYNLGNEATIPAISKSIVRKPNSVSDLLRRMEKRKLIIRRKPQGDQRSARYQLSTKGEEILSQAAKCNSIEKAMSMLSVDELNQFESFLRKIRESVLNDVANEMSPPWP